MVPHDSKSDLPLGRNNMTKYFMPDVLKVGDAPATQIVLPMISDPTDMIDADFLFIIGDIFIIIA